MPLPGRLRAAVPVVAAAGVTWIAAAVADEPGADALPWSGLVLAAVLGALQLARRRHPAAVLLASAAAVLAYHGAGLPAVGVAWPLVVPYLLAAAAGWWRLGGAVAAVTTLATLGWRGLAEHDAAAPVLVGAAQDFGLAALALAVGEAAWQQRRLRRETAARIAATTAAAERESERRLAAQRLEIAADLHDVAGHSLVLIGLQLRLATETIHRDPAVARRALAAALAAHDDALRDTAATVRLLHREDGEGGEDGVAPPAPGPQQVAELVAVAADAAVDLRLDLPDGTWDGVPAAVALTAYRICREAVTNTLQHSATARAELAVSRRDGALRLRYLDHGPPRPPAPRAAGGHGITGMTARARSLGGTLRAGRRGAGHLVEAELPLHPAVDA